MLLFAITQSAMAQSYYMVGQLLKSNVKDWSEKNEDGYKFETTDHVNYFYTVYNTTANFDFRFRIGTDGNTKATAFHPKTVETSGTHTNGRLLKKEERVTDMEQSNSNADNYWYVIMEADNSYTFHFNAVTKTLYFTKGTTLGKAKDFDLVAEYKNVAGTTVQKIVPFIESRVRSERDEKMPYSDILATAAFKDEQLPGKKGDKIRIYARKRDDNNITLNPATDESTFGEERQPAYGNNSSYSSIKSYKTESFVTNRPENAFVITKGDGVSYTVALNLGGEIKAPTSGDHNNISHYVKARSLSLFTNKSISKVYKEYAESKGKTYDEKTANFYLIGSMNGKKNDYKYKKEDAKLMERTVYTNPIDNTKTDSIVYTSLVKWENTEPSGLWFSFAPEIIYDLRLDWAPKNPYAENSAWNYIARAQVQDEYDATAQYGCMNISGNYGEVLCNGEQALNPKVKDPKYKYYVVRFNVTTSTYRLIFYEENPVIIKRSKNKFIRTFSSNANWDLPADGKIKAYVVHSFEKYEKDAPTSELKSQGVMHLREIKYIPAEMGVVLVGNGTDVTEDEIKESLTSKWEGLVDNKNKLWVKNYPDDTFNNYLVGLPTDGADITEGDYDEEHHCYVDRNFALNWFSNTKTGKKLIAEGNTNLLVQENGDAGIHDYLGFFRLKGKINKEYAYLKLPKSVVDYNLQLTSSETANDAAVKTQDAKLSPNFAMAFDTDFGTVSGINSLSNTKKNVNNSCYTLQGVKVQRPTAPGLYIMNGKKVIVK